MLPFRRVAPGSQGSTAGCGDDGGARKERRRGGEEERRRGGEEEVRKNGEILDNRISCQILTQPLTQWAHVPCVMDDHLDNSGVASNDV